MRLSNSRFTTGLQCHKRLYLQVHQPELAAEPDESTQARFKQGTEVGRVARGLPLQREKENGAVREGWARAPSQSMVRRGLNVADEERGVNGCYCLATLGSPGTVWTS
jgi:hypothetical protein